MSKQVGYDLFVMQNDETTSVMLHVDGDKAIKLFEYERATIKNVKDVAFISVGGPPMSADVNTFIAVKFTSSKDDPTPG